MNAWICCVNVDVENMKYGVPKNTFILPPFFWMTVLYDSNFLNLSPRSIIFCMNLLGSRVESTQWWWWRLNPSNLVFCLPGLKENENDKSLVFLSSSVCFTNNLSHTLHFSRTTFTTIMVTQNFSLGARHHIYSMCVTTVTSPWFTQCAEEKRTWARFMTERDVIHYCYPRSRRAKFALTYLCTS